jgi:hypothetical protein
VRRLAIVRARAWAHRYKHVEPEGLIQTCMWGILAVLLTAHACGLADLAVRK